MKSNIAAVMKKHVNELFEILAQYNATHRMSFIKVAETDRVFQKAQTPQY